MSGTDSSITKAEHLCVLVHGLWGNPGHLTSISKSLKEKYPADKLRILVPNSNADYFTYDGIEVGGERVAQEVEAELERLEKAGQQIKKLSVVGYSLGGLIARYCIGLLYSRGWFDKLEPVNFTAFASPFLGVRTPVRGYHSSLWNAFGSKTLSVSGQQLFLVDEFRDTGRPLLSILADPESIFMRALGKFKHRVLYANMVNDRSAPWFTTGISRTDPYENIDEVDLSFVQGYEKIVGDPNNSVRPKPKEEKGLVSTIVGGGQSFFTHLPIYALIAVLAPIGTTAFLINSVFQSARSSKRVKLHSTTSGYQIYQRIPLMIEGAMETLQSNVPNHYLSEESTSETDGEKPARAVSTKSSKSVKPFRPLRRMSTGRSNKFKADFPTLALTPEQFRMIENLDSLGWRKYPILISKVRHSHAAIIVRMDRDRYSEGWTVIKHWLADEFEL